MEAPDIVKEKMAEIAGCCEVMGDLAWTWEEDEDGYHRIHVRPAISLLNGVPGFPADIRWDIAALMSIFDEVKAIAWHPTGGVEGGLHIEAWDGAEFWISVYERPEEEDAVTVSAWSGATVS